MWQGLLKHLPQGGFPRHFPSKSHFSQSNWVLWGRASSSPGPVTRAPATLSSKSVGCGWVLTTGLCCYWCESNCWKREEPEAAFQSDSPYWHRVYHLLSHCVILKLLSGLRAGQGWESTCWEGPAQGESPSESPVPKPAGASSKTAKGTVQEAGQSRSEATGPCHSHTGTVSKHHPNENHTASAFWETPRFLTR